MRGGKYSPRTFFVIPGQDLHLDQPWWYGCMMTSLKELWREWGPRVEFQVPKNDEGGLEPFLSITISRFTLELFFWTRPFVEWKEPGYDGIWTSWGIFPLFNLEAYDKQLWSRPL